MKKVKKKKKDVNYNSLDLILQPKKLLRVPIKYDP